MVYLIKFNKYLSYSIFLLILSLSSIAEEENKKVTSVVEKIEELNINILDLEVEYELGESAFVISNETKDIENQLLYYEYNLGTPKGNDDQWNESEQMILDAKIKLQALQEKIKLEGDWGEIRFRIQDFGGENPGDANLRYNYGF